MFNSIWFDLKFENYLPNDRPPDWEWSTAANRILESFQENRNSGLLVWARSTTTSRKKKSTGPTNGRPLVLLMVDDSKPRISSSQTSVNRSTVADGTVDRQTRDGRLLVSTGRPLRLQEISKNGATRILRGIGWKLRKNLLLEYKYFTLGHFHARREPPLEIPLQEKGSSSFVSKICESSF